MYLGRYQLGEDMPLPLTTVDASNLPTAPDNAPVAQIFNSSGTQVMSGRMPVMDRYGTSTACTFFMLPVYLSGDYSAGLYSYVLTWNIAAAPFVETGTFEVVAGGDSNGTVIAMTFFHKPQADFVVYQTDAGKLRRGRGPKLP